MKYLTDHGYSPTICSTAKERIRCAGEKIKDETPLTTQDLDVGFRVLKLDDSNMKDVYYAADEYDQGSLADMVSDIKEDRTDLYLLFGYLLDWGLPLSLPYTSEQIDGCTVHTYNDGDLIACFDVNALESDTRVYRNPGTGRNVRTVTSPLVEKFFEVLKEEGYDKAKLLMGGGIAHAMKDGDPEQSTFMAGQSAGAVVRRGTCREIIERMMQEAREAALEQVEKWR